MDLFLRVFQHSIYRLFSSHFAYLRLSNFVSFSKWINLIVQVEQRREERRQKDLELVEKEKEAQRMKYERERRAQELKEQRERFMEQERLEEEQILNNEKLEELRREEEEKRLEEDRLQKAQVLILFNFCCCIYPPCRKNEQNTIW